ncbi:MAG: transposase [Bacteroidia bacterium]|nr:transposase [Bacteroidia bacterium]
MWWWLFPDISSSSMAPDPSYNVANFVFNEEENVYICPQGNALSTNGKWYKKDRNYEGRKKQPPILVQHYKTTACKTCPLINSCTKNTRGRGRVIERTEFAPYIEKNKLRMEQAGELYRKRQAIVEHPFGIIKRQWDFYYCHDQTRNIKSLCRCRLDFHRL